MTESVPCATRNTATQARKQPVCGLERCSEDWNDATNGEQLSQVGLTGRDAKDRRLGASGTRHSVM